MDKNHQHRRSFCPTLAWRQMTKQTTNCMSHAVGRHDGQYNNNLLIQPILQLGKTETQKSRDILKRRNKLNLT
jgi:hypothetical protein